MEAEKLKARRQGDNLLPRLFLMLSPDARLLWYVPINHRPTAEKSLVLGFGRAPGEEGGKASMKRSKPL